MFSPWGQGGPEYLIFPDKVSGGNGCGIHGSDDRGDIGVTVPGTHQSQGVYGGWRNQSGFVRVSSTDSLNEECLVFQGILTYFTQILIHLYKGNRGNRVVLFDIINNGPDVI